MKTVRFASLVVLGVLLLSCKKDMTIESMCVEIVSYSEKIQPLIELNCSTSNCHDVWTAQGGVNLVYYEGVVDNADKILSVIQLDEGNSWLMPFEGPKLADSLIQHFKCWSNQGRLNN
jgi:hypothetical protein